MDLNASDDEIKSDEKDEMVLYFADMDLAEEPNLKPKSTNKFERVPFRGDRYLTDESKVFDHNAWDDVEWNETQQNLAEQKINEISEPKVAESLCKQYENEANVFWDHFYVIHQNRFFKDRQWLFREFPELNAQNPLIHKANERGEEVKIWDLGCGVGNTVFPILKLNPDANIFVYCCDFSAHAINIVTSDSKYDPEKCLAFQFDLTSKTWSLPFSESSLDIVTMIFVLSAISPESMQYVLNQVVKYLKPNGLLLFRDYGRYDMTQLRFKSGRCLADNFYVRGDGTRAYFFTKEEVHNFLEGAGLSKQALKVERRLLTNRAKKQKMYRVWVQAKYMKK